MIPAIHIQGIEPKFIVNVCFTRTVKKSLITSSFGCMIRGITEIFKNPIYGSWIWTICGLSNTLSSKCLIDVICPEWNCNTIACINRKCRNIVITIKRICLGRLPKSVGCKASAIYNSIVFIAGFIICIPIKRPVTHKSLLKVCGKAGSRTSSTRCRSRERSRLPGANRILAGLDATVQRSRNYRKSKSKQRIATRSIYQGIGISTGQGKQLTIETVALALVDAGRNAASGWLVNHYGYAIRTALVAIANRAVIFGGLRWCYIDAWRSLAGAPGVSVGIVQLLYFSVAQDPIV